MDLQPVFVDGHTRRARDTPSAIDVVAVRAVLAWRWTVTRQWQTESDHVALTGTMGPGDATARATLKPASFKRLPAAALDDLRRRFFFLERAYHVPRVELSGLAPEDLWNPPRRPGEAPDEGYLADDAEGDAPPVTVAAAAAIGARVAA